MAIVFHLNDVLNKFDIRPLAGNIPDLWFDDVTDDSRKCGPGILFVAIEGYRADGHDYLEQAARLGCRCALVENGSGPRAPEGMHLVTVQPTRRVFSLLAHHVEQDPSREMTVFGISGTNGKTTVTWIMESIICAAGKSAGVMGTVNNRWKGQVLPAPTTTPAPGEIARILTRMHADGVDAVAMEISSHALHQYRVDGIFLAAAGFTNLTQDHLDYHGSMEDYRTAKQRLYTEILADNPAGIAVLNVDDPAGMHIAQHVEKSGRNRVLDYSMKRRDTGVSVSSVVPDGRGHRIRIRLDGRILEVMTHLPGDFNIQNCLVSVGMAAAAGFTDDAIAEGIRAMECVPGRFQYVDEGQPFDIVIDYAHTPDSLAKALDNARQETPSRLIVVFGAGGDRDNTKRPMMGRAAAEYADILIITNDNPRTEDPREIADMVAAGAREIMGPESVLEICLDRNAAIRSAISMAGEGDFVLVAGKGHENYQDVMGRKSHFDDIEVARNCICERYAG